MLTAAQIASIRALTLVEPALAAFVAAQNDYEIMAWWNAPAAPDFIVTKTTLSRHDILTATSLEGTTFAWAGGAYITRAQGERDAFREMFNSTGTVNPTTASIQAAFTDIFSGAGGVGNRAHIVAMGKRKATRAEKALATGTGTLIAPAALTFEGNIGSQEMSNILGAQ